MGFGLVVRVYLGDWIGFGDGLVDLDRALFLFMVGHFMIGSVFADVFSFDALTDTL
jgi:hypothetical protein